MFALCLFRSKNNFKIFSLSPLECSAISTRQFLRFTQESCDTKSCLFLTQQVWFFLHKSKSNWCRSGQPSLTVLGCWWITILDHGHDRGQFHDSSMIYHVSLTISMRNEQYGFFIDITNETCKIMNESWKLFMIHPWKSMFFLEKFKATVIPSCLWNINHDPFIKFCYI